jgi:hypothetical protein
MYSHDEDKQMFVSLLEEENVAAAEDEEQMMILVPLATLYTERNSKTRRGGSASGRRKGYIMLYADYFANEPLHPVYSGRFRMSQDLFLKIVYAVRDLGPYFRC